MLKQRLITAIILSLLVIASVFYLPATGFRALALLITSIGFWEFWLLFNNTIGSIGQAAVHQRKIDISYLLGFILICILAIGFIPANFTLSIGVFWWVIAPYFLWVYSFGLSYSVPTSLTSLFCSKFCGIEDLFMRPVDGTARQLKLLLLGILIFVPFFVGLVTLKEKFGPSVLIYFISIVCSADIGAYFAGRFLGKKLLAAKISPKKTIEGVFGGLLLALVVAKCSGFKPILLLLVIAVCLWSVIGDLFESMLKRIAGVKDSGRILPGHGGVYDRIDSLTAALPIFALIIQYI